MKTHMYNTEVKLNGNTFQEWENDYEEAIVGHKKVANIAKYIKYIGMIGLAVLMFTPNDFWITITAFIVALVSSYVQAKSETLMLHTTILNSHIRSMFFIEQAMRESNVSAFAELEDSIDEMNAVLEEQLGI